VTEDERELLISLADVMTTMMRRLMSAGDVELIEQLLRRVKMQTDGIVDERP
jgi:hypothetical protein